MTIGRIVFYFLAVGLTALSTIAAAALISTESSNHTSSYPTSNRLSLAHSVRASAAANRWVTRYTNCGGTLTIKAQPKGTKFRPCGISASIPQNCVKTGQAAAGDIYGWAAFKNTFPPPTGGEFPYARCHIIARQLFGSAAPENLFPCYQRKFNAEAMARCENIVANWLRANPGGQALYDVFPEYGNPNQPWPTSALVRAQTRLNGATGQLFSVRITNSQQAPLTTVTAATFQAAGFFTDPSCV